MPDCSGLPGVNTVLCGKERYAQPSGVIGSYGVKSRREANDDWLVSPEVKVRPVK